MSEEVEVVEGAPNEEIAIPVSGEIIVLNQPNKVLAEAAAYMGELKGELARVEAIVTGELARRMDKENVRTVKEEGFELSVTAPQRDWDLDKLRGVLNEMVEKDRITRDAANRVITFTRPKPTERVAMVELNKLLTGELPETVKKKLRACSTPSKAVRKAKVKKKAEAGA